MPHARSLKKCNTIVHSNEYLGKESWPRYSTLALFIDMLGELVFFVPTFQSVHC